MTDKNEPDAADDSAENDRSTEGENTENKAPDELAGMFELPEFDELQVNAVGDPDEWPVIKTLARDVNRHGECHLTVEEHDDELEVRVGTTVFDFDSGVLSIKTEVGYDNLRVSMSHVVSWHRPHDPFHT